MPTDPHPIPTPQQDAPDATDEGFDEWWGKQPAGLAYKDEIRECCRIAWGNARLRASEGIEARRKRLEKENAELRQALEGTKAVQGIADRRMRAFEEWSKAMDADDSLRATIVQQSAELERLRAALHLIADRPDVELETAATLHWDMRGWAVEALAAAAAKGEGRP